ncbi:NAD(P)H-dependent oxidoreductase [Psychroflexus sp. ALD_RP9]|uniref:NAD(P)H-dependent oxidoreductase n=1 Tax=Psychroflexus sp. ALD_RP9 TaxID=2777186 RepID=UPI001A8DF6AB|nr:NAD(P)H-dependent oxidoreductase [Psychroflexus sp. ALD_RP9]QSS97146.1 NAD(P)H-dependent oxidoreductase [Psychroflexus sp. ALD_RP9]
MNKLIDDLNWRYATKSFDSSKSIDDETLNTLKEAVRLTASSYGLQPYEVFIIQDKDLRLKLKSASFNQSQITDSDYLVVFAVNTVIDEAYLDRYIKNIAETREINVEDLSGMRDAIAGTVLQFPQDQKLNWAKKQAYIGLGNLLASAARLRIDACPMEGFDNKQYDEILNLEAKNLTSAVIATIGYRSEDDSLQNAKKVRKSNEEFFNHL